MLKKLKRPDQYIGLGVWLILPGGAVIKAPVESVKICMNKNGWEVESCTVCKGKWFYLPSEVFMTKKEAYQQAGKKLEAEYKAAVKRLKDAQEKLTAAANNRNKQQARWSK